MCYGGKATIIQGDRMPQVMSIVLGELIVPLLLLEVSLAAQLYVTAICWASMWLG